MAREPLSGWTARQLYNLADALLPPEPGALAFDWVPPVEAVLAGRGAGDRRRLRRILVGLELRSRLGSRQGFFQQPRPERARQLARLAPSDLGFLRELLAQAAREGQASQSSGA